MRVFVDGQDCAVIVGSDPVGVLRPPGPVAPAGLEAQIVRFFVYSVMCLSRLRVPLSPSPPRPRALAARFANSSGASGLP